MLETYWIMTQLRQRLLFKYYVSLYANLKLVKYNIQFILDDETKNRLENIKETYIWSDLKDTRLLHP